MFHFTHFPYLHSVTHSATRRVKSLTTIVISPKLKRIRNYCPRKIRNDKVTHGSSQLQRSENMLNAQDLYNHIRRYSDSCFLHTAYELILDILYPVMQQQMVNWCNPSLMTYPDVSPTTASRSRKRNNTAIDVDAVAK